jgi:hypothetical protein
MVDFAKLKANRAENTAKLIESLSKNQNGNEDARFWKPTMNPDTKMGGAVIRFLPSPDDDVLGYVRYYEHAFQNPAKTKWYIERSLSSIGQQDAVASLNRRLWATGIKENKDLASKQKRNERLTSNILVINDPAKPENNGKVFLYRFGPKILSFIDARLKPKEDPITGEKPPVMDAFDLWEGANFEIRFKDTDNGWNYDECKFSNPAPVAQSDALIEAIFKQTHSLQEFVDAKHYKSPDELAKRLAEVLGSHIAGIEVIEGSGFSVTDAKKQQSQQQAAPTKSEASAPITGTSYADTADTSVPFEVDTTTKLETTEDEEFFNSLMNES